MLSVASEIGTFDRPTNEIDAFAVDPMKIAAAPAARACFALDMSCLLCAPHLFARVPLARWLVSACRRRQRHRLQTTLASSAVLSPTQCDSSNTHHQRDA